ncbi:MAG: TldD/PmbA family protein [Candidatus Sericytochromatia bacterium]|nr:TldD/PmbA family protein [Candidatus Tanganyikabacteria bacterium]
MRWQPPVDTSLASEVIGVALSSGADFADLFVEDRSESALTFLDGRVKDAVSGQSLGAGIRVVHGQRAIYGYTSDLSRAGLLEVARAVASAEQGRSGTVVAREATATAPGLVHPVGRYPGDVPMQRRIDLFHLVDRTARAYSSFISQVEVSLAETVQNVLIANSEGLHVCDERPYSRFFIKAIATGGGERQEGHRSPGRLAGFEFVDSLEVEELAREAAEAAVLMLSADYCKAGRMPVVIDKGFGGVIFHEACGHLLETTSVAPRVSILSDKMGQQIAHPAVTAIDDGTLENEWGSLGVDDEGMPVQRTVLIREGILESYMVDRLGEIKTQQYARTGSARRQSYRQPPGSRMRNTFIAPGDASLEELIADVPLGLYAKRMGGGSVKPGTGDFNFAVREAYMIRDGKLAEPVRGAMLIGNGADILMKISKVGRDLELAAGMCGSVSGNVPVTVGQPALLVDEITVGGR